MIRILFLIAGSILVFIMALFVLVVIIYPPFDAFMEWLTRRGL